MFGFIKKLFGGNTPEVAEVAPYKVEAAPVVEQPAITAKKTPQAKPVQGQKPRGRKPKAN